MSDLRPVAHVKALVLHPVFTLAHRAAAVEVDILHMAAVVGGDGKSRLVGRQNIDIVHTDILDIVRRLRADLEQVAVCIADNIAHQIVVGRTRESKRTVASRLHDIIGSARRVNIECRHIVARHIVEDVAHASVGLLRVHIVGADAVHAGGQKDKMSRPADLQHVVDVRIAASVRFQIKRLIPVWIVRLLVPQILRL